MIILADLHIREESESTVFDEVLPGIEEVIEKSFDRMICILGDVYHLRYRVSVKLQNRLLDFLEKSKGFYKIIPGNHDQINPQGEHALEVFRELDNVTVYGQPTWDDFGLWIPYRKDPNDIERALTMTKPDIHFPSVAWMHHGVQGAFMNNSAKDTEGIPADQLGAFKRVFLGHYHKPHFIGSTNYIIYVGSPYQTRADEAGQSKGYSIWDPHEFNYKFVPMDWGKRYHRLTVNQETPVTIGDGIRPEDDIRIQAGPGVDPEVLGKVIAGQGFKNVVITPVQKATESRLQVDSSKGIDGYAQSYIEQFAGDLSQEALMKLYQDIVA